MPDLRDENFRKKNRKTNQLKRRKTLWYSFVLVIGSIVIFLLSFAYGEALAMEGYSCSGSSNKIALAMIEISEGVYPWNYRENSPKSIGIALEEQKNELLAMNDNDTLSDNYYEYAENNSDGISEKNDEVLPVGAEDEDVSQNDSNTVIPVSKKEFITVDDSYFDDAVFIGDSRMAGIAYYANIENATFYAKVAMTIYKLMDGNLSTDTDVQCVREGLENNRFGKIYIMVGINELGTADQDYYINSYREVIREIKQMQPNSIVYVQAILHVTAARSRKDKYINNLNINMRNKALKKLAEEEDCVFLDVNPVYDDEYGDLNKEYTADDVHLLAKYYEPWHEFYLNHAIEPNPVEESDISENDISENDISENDISENDISENDISENDISENDISENDISGNAASENIYEENNLQ